MLLVDIAFFNETVPRGERDQNPCFSCSLVQKLAVVLVESHRVLEAAGAYGLRDQPEDDLSERQPKSPRVHRSVRAFLFHFVHQSLVHVDLLVPVELDAEGPN